MTRELRPLCRFSSQIKMSTARVFRNLPGGERKLFFQSTKKTTVYQGGNPQRHRGGRNAVSAECAGFLPPTMLTPGEPLARIRFTHLFLT